MPCMFVVAWPCLSSPGLRRLVVACVFSAYFDRLKWTNSLHSSHLPVMHVQKRSLWLCVHCPVAFVDSPVGFCIIRRLYYAVRYSHAMTRIIFVDSSVCCNCETGQGKRVGRPPNALRSPGLLMQRNNRSRHDLLFEWAHLWRSSHCLQ